MRKEILEDTFVNPFVDGKEYQFLVSSVGERIATQKSFYREWVFSTLIDGNTEEIKMNLFPFQAIPMLEMLGYEKNNGKLEVDYDDIEGKKQFIATVYIEEYTNKHGTKSKSNKLKAFRPLNNEEIPF